MTKLRKSYSTSDLNNNPPLLYNHTIHRSYSLSYLYILDVVSDGSLSAVDEESDSNDDGLSVSVLHLNNHAYDITPNHSPQRECPNLKQERDSAKVERKAHNKRLREQEVREPDVAKRLFQDDEDSDQEFTSTNRLTPR